MSANDLRHQHFAIVVTDPVRNAPKTLKCPNVTLPVTLRTFSLKDHDKECIRVWQGHHKEKDFLQQSGNPHQGMAKIDLGFSLPKKQRHTAKRIYERIREIGYGGKYTQLKTAVRELARIKQEVFMPLIHRSGERQVDFGHALAKIARGYAGEMFFFTLFDQAAPCIEDRTTDTTWAASSRLAFARNAVRALNIKAWEGIHTVGPRAHTIDTIDVFF